MHTRGPWTMEPYGKTYNDKTDEWEHLHGRWHINGPSVDVHPVFDGSGRKDKYPDGVIIGDEESTANAKLIAAAPDMLAALQFVSKWEAMKPESRLTQQLHDAIQSAIDKATK